MYEKEQLQIINIINQLIQKSLYEDILENGKIEDGDNWTVHNLKLVRSLIEDYFKNEK